MRSFSAKIKLFLSYLYSSPMRNLSAVLWSHIRAVPDFPKPGICFYDLTPLFINNIGPLTDALIAGIPAEKLAEAGITLSRRTVAKYREEMGIRDASGRKCFGI